MWLGGSALGCWRAGGWVGTTASCSHVGRIFLSRQHCRMGRGGNIQHVYKDSKETDSVCWGVALGVTYIGDFNLSYHAQANIERTTRICNA